MHVRICYYFLLAGFVSFDDDGDTDWKEEKEEEAKEEEKRASGAYMRNISKY